MPDRTWRCRVLAILILQLARPVSAPLRCVWDGQRAVRALAVGMVPPRLSTPMIALALLAALALVLQPCTVLAAKTLADPEEPLNPLACNCSDIDPRATFTGVRPWLPPVVPGHGSTPLSVAEASGSRDFRSGMSMKHPWGHCHHVCCRRPT